VIPAAVGQQTQRKILSRGALNISEADCESATTCVIGLDQSFLNPKTIGSFGWLIPLKLRGVDSVVRTALPCKFDGENGRKPTVEMCWLISAVTGRLRDEAERYIRFALRQIDTPYRRRIRSRTPLDCFTA
jgi:hypothetical protein